MISYVHLLSHLAKLVRLWGPLWPNSAVVFENANDNLLKLVQDTKGIPCLFVNKFLLQRAIPHFASKHPMSNVTLVSRWVACQDRGCCGLQECKYFFNKKALLRQDRKTFFHFTYRSGSTTMQRTRGQS